MAMSPRYSYHLRTKQQHPSAALTQSSRRSECLEIQTSNYMEERALFWNSITHHWKCRNEFSKLAMDELALYNKVAITESSLR